MVEHGAPRGIPFIAMQELSRGEFAPQVQISHGTYGTIWSTTNPHYVVKKCKQIQDIASFVNELSAHAQLRNPCILAPKCWSVDGNEGAFVFPRGTDILTAYLRKWITIEQIFSDVITAMTFLHEAHWIHGDISPLNMLYWQGKCMLIDFGAARRSTPNDDGLEYTTSFTNTLWYLDPRYIADQWNDSRHELYSVFACIHAIMNGKHMRWGSLYGYGSPSLVWNEYVFDEATKPFSNRVKMNFYLGLDEDSDVAKTLIVRRHQKGHLYVQTFLKPMIDHALKPYLVCFMAGLVEYCHDKAIPIKNLILALHLIHLTFPHLANLFTEPLQVRCFVIVCLNIALAYANSGHQAMLGVTNCKVACQSNASDEDWQRHFDILFGWVLQVTRGVTSPLTYWDFARSACDLPAIVFQLATGTYDPNLIPRSPLPKTDKHLYVNDVISEDEIGWYSKVNLQTTDFTVFDHIPLVQRPTEAQPCILDLHIPLENLQELWQNGNFHLEVQKHIDKPDTDNSDSDLLDNEDFLQGLSYLLRAKDQLPELEQPLAYRIYWTLVTCFMNGIMPNFMSHVLDTLTHKASWRTTPVEAFLAQHPFPKPKPKLQLSPNAKMPFAPNTTVSKEQTPKNKDEFHFHVGNHNSNLQ